MARCTEKVHSPPAYKTVFFYQILLSGNSNPHSLSASKTKPLSRALHPIEDAYFHQSHLKKKQDYGHQAVAVMLSCNGIVLNYAFVMYNKSISKIDIVQNIMCTDMRETSTA